MDAPTGEQDAAIERAMEWLLRRETAPRDAILERDFQQWLAEAESHRAAYEAVRTTWAALGALPATPAAVPLPVPLPVRKPRRTRWHAAAAALAAACLLLVAAPILHRHVVADFETGVAELRQVTLPDGSVVQLDAGSAIAVDYAEADRRVTLLSGQAFFEVTRDGRRPFSVLAGDVSVVVTGTAFSVGKTTTTIEVAVRSGTVDVLQDGRRAGDPLTIGDRVTVDRRDGAVHRDRIAADSVASWRRHKLVVVDTSFGDIVEALGRYLPGVVLVGDGTLTRQAITGVFDLTQPVEALRTLAQSQDASVTEVTPYLLIVSRR
ncbi:MAG: FecR family protein [Pseudomonadota bacterium]